MFDIIIIGVQKSGTSWLYETLKQSSSLLLRKDKSEKGRFDVRTEVLNDWIKNNYDESNGRLFCDVSVDYILDPKTLNWIVGNYPNVKLNVLIRNPIERFISAVDWEYRKGKLSKMSSELTLDDLEVQEIKILIERSLYWKYLHALPQENLQIWKYEELKNDNNNFIHRFCEFNKILDIPSPSLIRHKKSTSNLMMKLENKATKFSPYLGKLVSKIGDRSNNIAGAKKMDRKVSKELISRFHNDFTLYGEAICNRHKLNGYL